MAAREIIRVPLAELEPDPAQPRTSFSEESLLGLAKTLGDGQLQPILAYRKQGSGRLFTILDGERRWRAAKLAKLSTVDVIVVEEPPEQGAVLHRQLIANLAREDLSPLETARGIDRLIKETGWAASRVALSLGLSQASVSRALALLTLPEPIQQKVEKGELAASAAYQISRAGDAASQQLLAEQAAVRGLTRDALAGKVKRAGKRSADTTPDAAPSRVTVVLGGGRSVTIGGPGLTSLDQLIATLEELLAKARKARPRGTVLSTFAAMLRDEAKAGPPC